MTLNLSGIIPNTVIDYTWVGDNAVDIEKSDLLKWFEDGSGLVLKEGCEPTIFKLKPITPTQKNYIFSIPSTMENMNINNITEEVDYKNIWSKHANGMYREICAYGIQSISGIKIPKNNTALGKKITDEFLTSLENDIPKQFFDLSGKELSDSSSSSFPVDIISHIGRILLQLAVASEHQKKV